MLKIIKPDSTGRLFLFLPYWVVLVGAVRKWLLPGFGDYLFFSIHIFLAVLYLKSLNKRMELPFPREVRVGLIALLIWGTLSVFNNRNPNLLVGALGWIIFFWFLIVPSLVWKAFPSRENLQNYLEKFFIYSAPVLILGFFQYFLPANHVLNRYVAETEFVATIAGNARITGTFSYLTGYGIYLNALCAIGLPVMHWTKRQKLTKRLLVLFVFGAVIANLFMTGSRGPVWISLGSVVLYVLILSLFKLKGSGRGARGLIVGAGLIIAFLSFSPQGKIIYENFSHRVKSTHDVSARLMDSILGLKFNDRAGLFGYGIGTTYQGANRFVSNWGDMPRDFEEEPERIDLELGLVGYILVYLIRLIVIYFSFMIFLKLKTSNLKALAISLTIYQLQFLFLSILVFQTTAHFFYWFFVGIIFILPQIEKRHLTKEASID